MNYALPSQVGNSTQIYCFDNFFNQINYIQDFKKSRKVMGKQKKMGKKKKSVQKKSPKMKNV